MHKTATNRAEILRSLRAEVAARWHIPLSRVRAVWAPYRICPLGAHIDHQLGPVTSMAIDRGVWLAYAPTDTRQIELTSRDFAGDVRFSLDSVPPARTGDWGNFPRGAVRALARDHALRTGICGVTFGRFDGGGLSSSAAFGVALLLALEDVNQLQVSVQDNIRLHSRIENDYLGMRIGVLDQASILLARQNCLTRIDCATLEHAWFPYASGGCRFTIMIAFSGVKQALATTGYNQRVAECRRAARALLDQAGRPDTAPLLGAVRRREYEAYRDRLNDIEARRAAHFFTEVERVERGIGAWKQGNMIEFGRLMTASGASSIENYQCGSPPLVRLYELLVGLPGVFGARFSGAGFRGCCVALVEPDAAAEIARRVRAEYQGSYPQLAQHAAVFTCGTDDGARVVQAPED